MYPSPNRPDDRTIFDDAESLGAMPSGGFIKAYVVGILMPIGVIAYGIYGIIQKESYIFWGSRNVLDNTVRDESAISLSIGFIAVALVMHFHYYWGFRGNQAVSYIGKCISIIGIIIALGGLFYYELIADLPL